MASSLCQLTPAYVSLRQLTSAYVSYVNVDFMIQKTNILRTKKRVPVCRSMPQYAAVCPKMCTLQLRRKPTAVPLSQGPSEDFFMLPLEASGRASSTNRSNRTNVPTCPNMSYFKRFTYSYQTIDGERICRNLVKPNTF